MIRDGLRIEDERRAVGEVMESAERTLREISLHHLRLQ
jgi:hypothetical protein